MWTIMVMLFTCHNYLMTKTWMLIRFHWRVVMSRLVRFLLQWHLKVTVMRFTLLCRRATLLMRFSLGGFKTKLCCHITTMYWRIATILSHVYDVWLIITMYWRTTTRMCWCTRKMFLVHVEYVLAFICDGIGVSAAQVQENMMLLLFLLLLSRLMEPFVVRSVWFHRSYFNVD